MTNLDTTAAVVAATPVAPVAKPSRADRRAAKALAKKEAKATVPHKPTQIVRTEDNPAKSIVPVRFKQAYALHDDSNGDEVAYAVKAFITRPNKDGRPSIDPTAIMELAEANGIDYAKYTHLNVGQRSMNVRNRLRGLLKSGKTIVVGTRKFADKAKALAVRPVAVEQASV